MGVLVVYENSFQYPQRDVEHFASKTSTFHYKLCLRKINISNIVIAIGFEIIQEVFTIFIELPRNAQENVSQKLKLLDLNTQI